MSEPTKQYGFVECSAEDTRRVDFWCPSGYWITSAMFAGTGKCQYDHKDCGKHWRKPVEIPDGWELVPEGEIETAEMRFCRFGKPSFWEDNFLTTTPHRVEWFVTDAPSRYLLPEDTVIAFIRRKPEQKKEQDAPRWIPVSERLPEPPEPVVWLCKNGNLNVYQHGWVNVGTANDYQNTLGYTHWCRLIVPDYPEKSDAEKAWDKWCKSIDRTPCNPDHDKEFFIMGYNAVKGATK